MKYLHKRAPKEHDPTVEDTYKFVFKSKRGDHDFQIIDTAGEEDYQDMLDSWISSASGFILVFAINDLESFQSLKTIIDRINKNQPENFPFVVVGNKCDLGLQRKVSVEQGVELAYSLKAYYFETSALTDNNGNVKKAFEECASWIINKTGGIAGKKKCCRCCSIF